MLKKYKLLKTIDLKTLNYSKKLNSFEIITNKGSSFYKNNSCKIFLFNKNGFQNMFLSNKSEVTTFIRFFKDSFNSFSKGYFFELKLRGVGFKVYFINENNILFNLGYSHSIVYNVPFDVLVFLKKGKIFLYSISKEKLGAVVRDLKNLRIADAYKAKGIVSKDQVFNLKEGKKR